MISCRSGLSRKLALRMALVAVCSVVLTVAGFLAIQVFILKQPILLDTRDYVAIVSFCILGVVMGSVAANHLARQIVSPVRRIAAAARRISENDLSARVDEPDETMGEVQELARDFNLMAVRLDRLAKERKQWRDAISHELRTPLMILRGHLQGGLDGIYPNDDRLLSLALSQVETLTRVMGDLAAMEDAEDPGLRPDFGFAENFVFANIPAGDYQLVLRLGDRTQRQNLRVEAGQTATARFVVEP